MTLFECAVDYSPPAESAVPLNSTTRTSIGQQTRDIAVERTIASDFKPLFEEGVMSRTQYLSNLNQVQEIRAEVATLKESSRVIGSVAGQLNRIDRQIIQIRAELVGLKETISYRTVRAPIDGKVFDPKCRLKWW